MKKNKRTHMIILALLPVIFLMAAFFYWNNKDNTEKKIVTFPSSTTAQKTPQPPSTTQIVENEKKRLDSLLRRERIKTDLEKIEPIVSAQELEAYDALGYRTPGGKIIFSIYILEHQREAAQALKVLEQHIPQGEYRTLNAVNGRMLFFGYADVSGSDGKKTNSLFGSIASAFAGDE